MSAKRDYDVDDGELSEPSPKRAKKHSAEARQHQNSSIDPTYGQKYVFSSSADATTIPIGEESDFEDDADAMAYLMSVRQQANGIPHILIAPKPQIGPQLPRGFQGDSDDEEEDGEVQEEEVDREIYTNGIGDSRGYYENGAYVAYPESVNDDQGRGEGDGVEEDDHDSSREALVEAYFASMLRQYLHMRSILGRNPPANASARFDSSQPTFAAPFSRKSNTARTWSQAIRNTEPHPLQLALMSKDSVIRVLRVLLGGKFLHRGHVLPERTSRWLWGLLARLPDRGGLNHVEIGWIRDLGKRAVLLGRSLAEMAALRDELAESGLGVNDGVDGSSSDEDVVAAEFDDAEDAQSLVDAPTVPMMAPKPTAPYDEGELNLNAGERELDKDGPPETSLPNGNEDDESEGQAMDLASDFESSSNADSDADDLEAAKRGLLAQLDAVPETSDEERKEEAARERSRMNMRATLNMILTVAGDFYGQRDLLEFREPFVGM